ncbi:MAG: UDP-4-amino-4,6-dideoxy-N-acetyl-beta-L-altrosamine transaminase [Pseudomonadota bacterium]
MKPIPYGRQDVNETDIQAVIEVLRSDWLTQGPAVERFERAVADYCGAGFAVATCNATAALHLACRALELGPGDMLWTSPNSFVASANCALYCGAAVDFVDIDPRTYNMSVEALEDKLTLAEKQGRLPKIVVPVHFAGQACDMRAIRALAERYGFRIIEDASHAMGGSYHGERVGSGRYADITVFSFHPVKLITTGEGGMALTNDSGLARRLQRLRSHGISREPESMRQAPEGPWCYEQIELGFNYRLTDIQAALGLSQLQRLDGFVERRHELARRYDALLAGLPVIAPWRHPDAHSAFHLYVIRLRLDAISRTRREVFAALREAGIGVNVHYIPIHTQPYYRQLGFMPGTFPQAEKYYAAAITLPLHPQLTTEEQDKVCSALCEAVA